MELSSSKDFFSHLVKLRRSFHAEPELAYEEVKTAQKIIQELNALQLPYEYSGPGSGVVARLKTTNPDAPTIALRAEMDALPLEEKTGLSFASQHDGCMHACGHDAHMAIILGAARLLANSPPPGNVIFVFQPAEEKGAGAKRILATGALEGVEAIFAGHVTQHYRLGEMMISNGVITAQSDRFKVNIHGKGGHGARPHEAIDAIIIAGLFISAIQTLVSREINPFHPSVVSIGQMKGGSAPNVIAENVLLEGTIRTTLPEVRQHIFKGLKRMAKAMGELYNAVIELEISHGYPPVINTDKETVLALEAAKDMIGSNNLVAMDYPSMGGEDFSYYLQKIPGCFVRFGTRTPGKEYTPLHSPSFDINEKVLLIGSQYFDHLARRAMRHGKK